MIGRHKLWHLSFNSGTKRLDKAAEIGGLIFCGAGLKGLRGQKNRQEMIFKKFMRLFCQGSCY